MTSLGRHPSLTRSLSAIFKVQLRDPVICQKKKPVQVVTAPLIQTVPSDSAADKKRHIGQIFLCTDLLSGGNFFPHL